MQINRLFCKPICKPDAAGQAETGRRRRSKNTSRRRSTEVKKVTRDSPRRLRRVSYGS
jgi:hypothetical protein